MTAPTVKVTMLGHSGSGKTTFTIGMLASMGPGEDDYAVSTRDWDHGMELLDAWSRLLETGKFPKFTDMSEFKEYAFVLQRGLAETVVTVDWVDYRGGALNDRAAATDTAALRARLEESDSVYIVLDGGILGGWIDEIAAGTSKEATLASARHRLGIAWTSNMLLTALDRMRSAGRRVPSLVVLVTKSDQLHEVLAKRGADKKSAELSALNAVRRLLPFAFSGGACTLIDFVSVGRPGAPPQPSGFKPPFLFTFLRYLHDAVATEERVLQAATAKHERTAGDLALLARRFGGGFFQSGKRDKLTALQQQLVAESSAHKARLEQLAAEAAKLEAELAGAHIFRNGDPGR
ncbi:hypothetical protein [Kibdelosporangium phytohabitans]|uniref:Uncharacterized protein n=1 Tax=Kibdelosporangium phytohabitans TaxID=860235 RepID=A0A0N9I473_9PSEU|nr:hypothetical protein [Kibdelosporangium phytohabitans]ALG09608.1 hypothetical protein AOZ06_24300 [Kibdelosporangium phytohabitans]MBE1469055.1 hypothetical protein [Kibdelosporangium phytohabitans]